MIPEHERLVACLKDVTQRGLPPGSKTKPMPPKEGPLWQAFVEWAREAQIRADHYADSWRAFCAGAEAEIRANSEGR